MRISDWSSDVCSSDLAAREIQRGGHSGRHRILERRFQHDTAIDDLHGDLQLVVELHVALPELRAGGRDLLAPLRGGLLIERLVVDLRLLDPVEHIVEHRRQQVDRDDLRKRLNLALRQRVMGIRSEEHTSELQSLMRISYAVFCSKKKKQ